MIGLNGTWNQANIILKGQSGVLAGHYKCWSCTYIFAGEDGSSGYECVDKPANFSNIRELDCHEDNQCVIDSVYDLQIEPPRLLSMDRGCRKPTKENGCSKVSSRPSCTFSCDSNLCNGIHGDLIQNIYKDTNGAPSLLFQIYLTALCCLRVFLI
ncbi:hypothetical protein LOTGIDRAFT_230488 [Lottia gigantea]|uniref:Uncharacterized protein n=1 Tax=Lottia gigantea TaxID=225164 RepID=V4AG84_LOTGI|nr:hypothetical protein LOTGIDRAFT_230488 [Lottia gigantea]ESP03054.1 hypothetical protein LOTGIDRAFT_230488 [Lottia gigantea]